MAISLPAAGQTAGTTTGTTYGGATVSGHGRCSKDADWSCYMTNGPAISVDGIKQFQGDQTDAIRTFGKNVSQAIQANASAQTNTLTAYLAGYAEMERSIQRARAAARVLNDTASWNTPLGACVMPMTVTTYQRVLQEVGPARAALRKAQMQRDVAPLSAANAVIAAAAARPEDLSAQSLYPTQDNPNGPSSATQVNTYIGMLTNAMPQQGPGPASNTTVARTQWTAQVKGSLARLSLAQQTLGDVAAAELPSVNTTAGPLSLMNIVRQEVAKRADSPAWQAAIAKEGSAGLAKDLAMMGAVSLVQQKRFLDLANNLLAVQTARYAGTAIDPLVTQSLYDAAAARLSTVLP
jgi:hypothetical protein